MYKFKTHQCKPLVKNTIQRGIISKVQGNLCPSLRNIIETASRGGVVLGAQHVTLSPDSMPVNYDNLSFTERYKRFKELEAWYLENEESCKRIEQGDFSEFMPKPDPEPALPVTPES